MLILNTSKLAMEIRRLGSTLVDRTVALTLNVPCIHHHSVMKSSFTILKSLCLHRVAAAHKAQSSHIALRLPPSFSIFSCDSPLASRKFLALELKSHVHVSMFSEMIFGNV